MNITVADIERRYREMTDEQLLALHPTDLTAAARVCHANEAGARGLPVEVAPDEPAFEGLSTLTKGDSRRPVLYLRSFQLDRKTQYFIGVQNRQYIESETQFLLPFREIGPVVAIDPSGKRSRLAGFGNPAMRVQPARDWQRLFFELLAQAQLVVIHAGSTDSLLWEIEQVFTVDPFVPTLLLMPRLKGDMGPAFGETFKSITGIGLPKDFHSSSVIFFPRRNQVLPVPNSPEDRWLNLQLHEFVGPLCRVLETIHPGVRISCAKEARGNFYRRVSLAVGFGVTSLLFYYMVHGCQ